MDGRDQEGHGEVHGAARPGRRQDPVADGGSHVDLQAGIVGTVDVVEQAVECLQGDNGCCILATFQWHGSIVVMGSHFYVQTSSSDCNIKAAACRLTVYVPPQNFSYT